MKILGFETNEGLRLGVVEGDNGIDLQAVDPRLPVNLADVLAQTNGDLKPLGELANPSGRAPKKGPPQPPKAAQGPQARAAGRAAAQEHLPRAELHGARQG